MQLKSQLFSSASYVKPKYVLESSKRFEPGEENRKLTPYLREKR